MKSKNHRDLSYLVLLIDQFLGLEDLAVRMCFVLISKYSMSSDTMSNLDNLWRKLGPF